MLTKQSSGSAKGLANWYDTPGNGERGDTNTTRLRGPGKPDSPPAVIASITEAVAASPRFWSSVSDFFLEGLASCGTSLHQVMFFMEQPAFSTLNARPEGRCVPTCVAASKPFG